MTRRERLAGFAVNQKRVIGSIIATKAQRANRMRKNQRIRWRANDATSSGNTAGKGESTFACFCVIALIYLTLEKRPVL